MATRHELMQRVIHEYRRETGEKDADMHKVARFAVKRRGMKLPVPPDPYDMLAKEFAAAAREEIRYDHDTKRPYRANHCYSITHNGKQLHCGSTSTTRLLASRW